MQKYIDSGILEIYVLGAASEEEVKELMYMKAKHPEVSDALKLLEADMEKLARNIAVTPPPGTWNKIEQEINDLIIREKTQPARLKINPGENGYQKNTGADQYISIESESNHMRIHKAWRWVFAGVFVLGKIFLGFAIYFYLENRQAQQQIQELKTEMRQLKK